MKKLLNKIVRVMNKPSYEVNQSIFIAMILIMIVASRFVDQRIIIVFEGATVLVMLIYIIMSIIRHDDVTKTLLSVITLLLAVCAVIAYYYKLKGLDLSIMGIILPIVFMLLFITGYANVKKSGDITRINNMRICMILGIVLMLFVELFFIYMYSC